MADLNRWPQPLADTLTACLEALDIADLHTARQLAGHALALAIPDGRVALADAVLVAALVDQAQDARAAAADSYRSAAGLPQPHADEPAARTYPHAQMELAVLRRTLGHYHRAEHALKQALAHHSDAVDPQDTAMLHSELGVVSTSLGKFDQAADHFWQAFKLLRDIVSPNHPEIASVWHNVGSLARARGDCRSAEKPARRALAIRERTLGPDHPTVAADRAALAPVLLELGQVEEAEVLLRDALTVFERTYGPGHPTYAIALSDLAALTHRQGDLDTALSLYNRALTTLEHAVGPEHPNVAPILVRLANLHHAAGQPDEADALETRAHCILSLDPPSALG